MVRWSDDRGLSYNRHVEESRGSIGQGAGESQVGVT
ncbi:MAG: hypothetical protein ACI8V4_002107 [Ilumatobacter sp.]|jgi:hypothetical protein